tara:strand:+ start:2129 stop:2662 length:534 start_codon:yes stop_codon:yes gene_type:complete
MTGGDVTTPTEPRRSSRASRRPDRFIDSVHCDLELMIEDANDLWAFEEDSDVESIKSTESDLDEAGVYDDDDGDAKFIELDDDSEEWEEDADYEDADYEEDKEEDDDLEDEEDEDLEDEDEDEDLEDEDEDEADEDLEYEDLEDEEKEQKEEKKTEEEPPEPQEPMCRAPSKRARRK